MKHLCFIGDGVLGGEGDTDLLGWVGRLYIQEQSYRKAHKPLFHAFNLGVEEDTSRDIAARWSSEATARLLGHEEAGLVFSFGLNDMAESEGEGIRVPLLESMDTAERLIATARAAWPLLWIGPAPIRQDAPPLRLRKRWVRFSRPRLEGINGAFRNIAKTLGVPYLDLMSALDPLPEWQETLRTGNGIYPTAMGHALIARMVWRWPPWRAWMDHPGFPLPGPSPVVTPNQNQMLYPQFSTR